MATPRKPGARRGRPPKPKPIVLAASRLPGAPQKHLRQHPDRYLIAALDVLQNVLGTSQRQASIFLVLNWVAAPVVCDGTHFIGTLPAPMMAAAERAGKALCRTANRLRTLDDVQWRLCMARAICVAYFWENAISQESAKRIALRQARSVGEEQFARSVLLPVIEGFDPCDLPLIPPFVVQPFKASTEAAEIVSRIFR